MFKLTKSEISEILKCINNMFDNKNIVFWGPCDCTSCTGCHGCEGCATYGEYPDGWHASFIGKVSKV